MRACLRRKENMNNQVANTVSARASARLRHAVRGFLGGASAIALMSLLGHVTNSPLVMAPFGASSVLLFGAPYSPFAQPRNLVLGHLLANESRVTVSGLVGGVFPCFHGTSHSLAARIAHAGFASIKPRSHPSHSFPRHSCVRVGVCTCME